MEKVRLQQLHLEMQATKASDRDYDVKEVCWCSFKQNVRFPVDFDFHAFHSIAALFHLALAISIPIVLTELNDARNGYTTAGTILFVIAFILCASTIIKNFMNPGKQSQRCSYSWLFGYISIFALMFIGVGILYDHVPKTHPLVLTTSTSFTFPEPLKSLTCNGTTYTDDNWTDWIKCASAQIDRSSIPSYNLTDYGFFPIPKTEILTEPIPLWFPLWLFCVFTAFFHLFCAISDKFQEVTVRTRKFCCIGDKKYKRIILTPFVEYLENEQQPFRWLEYSITASIMIICILGLSRVTDFFQIIYAFLLMACINTFGAAIDAIDIRKNFWIVVWMWTVSFIAFIAQFALIFFNFEYTIAPYLDPDLETKNIWSRLFDFIRILNWTILFLFCTFPVNNLYHQYYRYWSKYGDLSEDQQEILRKRYITRAEFVYIILSFVSKTFLIAIVYVGIAQRRNG